MVIVWCRGERLWNNLLLRNIQGMNRVFHGKVYIWRLLVKQQIALQAFIAIGSKTNLVLLLSFNCFCCRTHEKLPKPSRRCLCREPWHIWKMLLHTRSVSPSVGSLVVLDVVPRCVYTSCFWHSSIRNSGCLINIKIVMHLQWLLIHGVASPHRPRHSRQLKADGRRNRLSSCCSSWRMQSLMQTTRALVWITWWWITSWSTGLPRWDDGHTVLMGASIVCCSSPIFLRSCWHLILNNKLIIFLVCMNFINQKNLYNNLYHVLWYV